MPARTEYPEKAQTVSIEDGQIALSVAQSDVGFSGCKIQRNIELLICLRIGKQLLESLFKSGPAIIEMT